MKGQGYEEAEDDDSFHLWHPLIDDIIIFISFVFTSTKYIT